MSTSSLPPANGNSHAETNGTRDGTAASSGPPAEFASLVALAEQIAAQPERLALNSGDSSVAQGSMDALQAVFSNALKSEASSLPHISKFLLETLGPDPAETRSKSKKRKRPAATAKTHSFFAPTPLEGLVTEGMGTDQLWQQLEYRGKAIEKVLSEILVYAGGQDENGEGEPDDELELKSKNKEAEEELDDAAPEEIVNHLSSLSDAELRALGIDPELRDQLMADDDDNDGDFEPDLNGEDEEEKAYPEGYPGASDLSSDEDEEDYQPGSSKRVYLEPLKTEKEQRKKKEEQERRDLDHHRQFASLRQSLAAVDDDDDDDDESDADEEEEMEEDEPSECKAARKPASLLDQLDEPGASTSGSGSSKRKGSRHPTLDDDFFSIDDFNRETEEAERREIFKEAGADDGEVEEDVDMFRPLEGDDADMDLDDADKGTLSGPGAHPADIRYADFFLPPPNGHSGNKGAAQRRAKGKGKGSRVGQGAKLAKQERDKAAAEAGAADSDNAGEEEEKDEDEESAGDDDGSESNSESEDDDETPSKPTKVRFAPTVAIRNIKARAIKSMFDSAITPEMLSALYGEGDGSDDDNEDDDDEDDDEDEDDDADMDEEMDEGSDGASDDSGEGVDDTVSDDSQEEREVESEAGESAFDEERQDMTARRFAGDLFEDDDEGSEGEGDSSSKLSAHERRLAELQREISRLESENVGAKDWTLAGEASSRARPKDSLLEEDLEFEQSAKPTPTITIERTESLEELIKRRILEGRFDDVVPRRVVAQPEYKPDFELSDRKSSRGLAEEYEADYQSRAGDGDEGGYKGESERRLEKDKAEVEELMNDLFDKLDALSNAHFVPKAPQGTITMLTNAPALTAESGLPTSVGETSRLAPQEVFNNREGGRVNAILDGSQETLTPEEKKRLHQRRKKEKKSAHETREREQQAKMLNRQAGKKVQGGSSAGETRREKQDALKKLIGNKGVSVVGKGGADAASKGKGKGKASHEGEKKAEKFKL